MGFRRSIAAALVGFWLCLSTSPLADTVAPISNAHDVAEVLSAATNLPQILAQNPAFATEADGKLALEAERQRLLQVLRSAGYLQARIVFQWPSRDTGDQAMLQVRVDAGPRHTIGSVNLAVSPVVIDALQSELQSIASSVVASEADDTTTNAMSKRLLWVLGKSGFPFAKITQLEAQPSGDNLANLLIRVESGPLASFVRADLSAVDPELRGAVASLVPFSPGDLYSVEKLAVFRETLAQYEDATGTRVDIVPDGPLGFGLVVRADRAAHELLKGMLSSGLGLGLLLVSLCLLAIRQVVVSGRLGSIPLRVINIATGGSLLTSACILAVHAASLI